MIDVELHAGKRHGLHPIALEALGEAVFESAASEGCRPGHDLFEGRIELRMGPAV